MAKVKGPVAPDEGLITYDNSGWGNCHLSQPSDVSMDFGQWQQPKMNWFKRQWRRFTWWRAARHTSWYKASKTPQYLSGRKPFPDVAMVVTTEKGVTIIDVKTDEVYLEIGDTKC